MGYSRCVFQISSLVSEWRAEDGVAEEAEAGLALPGLLLLWLPRSHAHARDLLEWDGNWQCCSLLSSWVVGCKFMFLYF